MRVVESNRELKNKELTQRMIEIHTASKQRYRLPKIHFILRQEGYSVSLKRVQHLMSEVDIRSITQKKYRPYSSKHQVEERDNLLHQDFSTTTINEKLVADITYIYTRRNGWCYLASVLNLHSKKIVGYSFSRTMMTDLVIQALDNANPAEGLIVHTDLGSQYTS